ncbi:putative TAF10-TFIID and SAGA subunit [Choanephora cucurbitarum]|nr:putative TAF10-TFIID and SAGA subunit [Choanephora cucurbitarum]KAI8356624.1 putative TAF10-TFIID and SAGA subunit [Choanephora cucurbitarum]
MNSTYTDSTTPATSFDANTDGDTKAPKSLVDNERQVAEILASMDNYTSIIPENVIDYYLSRSGFDCEDTKIKKLFALAAQKYLTDVAEHALKLTQSKQNEAESINQAQKKILRLEELSSALMAHSGNEPEA